MSMQLRIVGRECRSEGRTQHSVGVKLPGFSKGAIRVWREGRLWCYARHSSVDAAEKAYLSYTHPTIVFHGGWDRWNPSIREEAMEKWLSKGYKVVDTTKDANLSVELN